MKVLGSPDIAGNKLVMHLVVLIEGWQDVKEPMDYVEEEIVNVIDE